MTKSATENTRYAQGVVLMIIVALIGASMPVAIKKIISSVSPSLQIALRFTIGAVVFAPFARNLNIRLVRDGIVVGLLMFGTFTSETIGLETLPANQAAFVYGLIVVLVTVFEVMFRRRLSLSSVLAAVLAFTGIGIMGWDNGPPPIGEFWLLLCAFFSAGWIITLEMLVPQHPPLPFTSIQLLFITVLCWLWAAPELIGNFEVISTNLTNLTNLGVLLYLGIVCTAIVMWLQTEAQRRITAFEAGLIETLGPVFGAILAFFLLGETFGTNGFVGAGIVLVAMILALSQIKASESSNLTSLAIQEQSIEESSELIPLAIKEQSKELSPE